MPAGLTIYNDSGTVQIDESYKNLAFKERRAIVLSHSFGRAIVDVVVAGPNIVMAMQSGQYAPTLINTDFDGTNWTYRWGFEYDGTFSPGDTAYAYIFDVAQASSDTCGLEVYDASSVLVYNSNVRPLKIVSVQAHATPYTGTSGRVYVPLISEISVYTVISGTFFFYATLSLRSSGNSITSIETAFGVSPGPVSPSAGTYAAIDVTGYT